jgi:YidC/Oxa1 family membrane protein insertase
MKREPEFDQKQLLLAVVLSGVVLVLWQMFFAPPPPAAPPPGEQVAGRSDAGTELERGPAAPAPTTAVAAAPPAPGAGGPIAPREPVSLGAAGGQSIEVGNVDGQLTAWILDEPQYRHHDEAGAETPLRFVDGPETVGKGIFLPPLLALELAGETSRGDYQVQKVDDHTATATWTDPKSGVQVTRRYEVDPGTHMVQASIHLKNPGAAPVPYDLTAMLRGIQNDSEAGGNMFSPPVYLFEAVCRHRGDFERIPVTEVRENLADPDEPTRFADGVLWGGVDNRYFMTAFTAPEGEIEDCDLDVGAEAVGLPPGAVASGLSPVVNRLHITGGEVAPGGTVERSFTLYGGPKKLHVLRVLDPPMDEAIDFGFFSVICLPMLWLMRFFHGFVANWGLAIILLTVLVKLITLPLTHKQYKSMAAMKAVQPQLKALQEKHKDDKVRLQQEMMKLYKEHKVNPLAGCLPMFLMMPIYFALYRTIYSAVELYQADFFGWITDLSKQDPYYITPVLLGVLMLIQMRLNPQTGDDMQQKIMMYAMPIMFTGMMLFLPSGLVVYIMVNTVLGIAQQYVLVRKSEESVAAMPAKRRKEAV